MPLGYRPPAPETQQPRERPLTRVPGDRTHLTTGTTIGGRSGDPEGERDIVVAQPCRAEVGSGGAHQRTPGGVREARCGTGGEDNAPHLTVGEGLASGVSERLLVERLSRQAMANHEGSSRAEDRKARPLRAARRSHTPRLALGLPSQDVPPEPPDLARAEPAVAVDRDEQAVTERERRSPPGSSGLSRCATGRPARSWGSEPAAGGRTPRRRTRSPR